MPIQKSRRIFQRKIDFTVEKDEKLENGTDPEEIFPEEGYTDQKEEISIQDFINRKKLQNRILGEIIEKITGEDASHKPV